jgi:hypothetical protein
MADFLHRDAFELVWGMAARVAIEPRQRAAPQLLGTLRRDVDEQKPTAEGYGGVALGVGLGIRWVCVLRHAAQRVNDGHHDTQPRAWCPCERRREMRYFTSTEICLGFASSRLGSVMVSTPSLYNALIFVASTVPGSENERVKLP